MVEAPTVGSVNLPGLDTHFSIGVEPDTAAWVLLCWPMKPVQTKVGVLKTDFEGCHYISVRTVTGYKKCLFVLVHQMHVSHRFTMCQLQLHG